MSRNRTPLTGAVEYLWNQLQRFPHYDDWTNPDPPKTEEHLWYERGWETLHHLEDHFFRISSSCGNRWLYNLPGAPNRLYNVRCQFRDCEEWCECILRCVYTGKGGSREDEGYDKDAWVTLLNAPVFLCFPHYYQLSYGKKYVPPTEEQTKRNHAFALAMERIHKEFPPVKLEMECGLTVDSFMMMDEPYLRRLAEVAKEEYAKLDRVN